MENQSNPWPWPKSQESVPLPLPVPMSFSHFTGRSDGRRLYRRDFSSVKDFCEQPFSNSKNEDLFMREENGGKFRLDGGASSYFEWYGASSAQEAMDHSYKGWPEGAERVRKMMQQVDAPPPVSLRRKVQRADQGDELDIHSVYRGDLDHAWTRRRRQSSRSRMNVRLMAQIGGSHAMTSDEMFWRGAAVAKLAELLEESSYRVEVIGAACDLVEFGEGEQHSFVVQQTFIVKDAGAPMDLEQVAGVLCNAGFFRTYGFRSTYAAPDHDLRDTQIRKKMKDGKEVTTRATLLARTAVRHVRSAEQMGVDSSTTTFVVPVDVKNASEARAWVEECLASLEAEVQHA
jgi:hypothetical protein